MRTISCWGGVLRSSLPVAARLRCRLLPLASFILPSAAGRRLRLLSDPSPPGRRPWGGPGEGGAAPDLAAEAPAEAVTQEAEATAEATTQGGAEATAEAAAHKANQPAEASALTEAEAPVTAAQTKAPAAAATRKLWWNLFRICYISAVTVSCTVEDPSLAFVFERVTSPRTAGALQTSARDACAALDSERTCSAASAVAERSASASAARAVAVGCTVEQGVATVRCAASPRTAGALLASARDACAALDYDWARPAAASTVAELSASASAASASAASAVAAAVTVEYSSLASVIESDNSHRTASASRFSFHSFTSGSAPRLASVKGDSRMSTTPSSCRLRPCPHRRRDLRYIPDAFSIGPGGGRLNSDACAALHTRYTRCTSTAHPAPCPMNVDTPASHPLCHNRVTWTSLSRRVLSVAMS